MCLILVASWFASTNKALVGIHSVDAWERSGASRNCSGLYTCLFIKLKLGVRRWCCYGLLRVLHLVDRSNATMIPTMLISRGVLVLEVSRDERDATRSSLVWGSLLLHHVHAAAAVGDIASTSWFLHVPLLMGHSNANCARSLGIWASAWDLACSSCCVVARGSFGQAGLAFSGKNGSSVLCR